MLLYDNQEVSESLYTSKIIGKDKTYSFYSPPSVENKNRIDGENLILISSFNTLEKLKLFKIAFIKNLSDFISSKEDWTGIHQIHLLPVKDEKEADKIISDILSEHKDVLKY